MSWSFIAFTGHRNRTVPETELDRIAAEFPGAIWLHGGAEGFDTQAHRYAEKSPLVLRPYKVKPDYAGPGDKTAPLMRNEIIVRASPVLVCCWDGREIGGTYRTVRFAESLGKRVIRLELLP